VILIAMLFLMPMGAGGFLSGLWRKATKTRSATPGQKVPASLGHEVGMDLTGSLSRADAMGIVRGERAEP
jgi:hypothetical protein